VAAKHPNVWIDTSVHMPKYYPQPFVHFMNTYGKHKCIWASDWPMMTFDATLTGVDELCRSDEVRRLFLHDNAVAAFALDKP
jgi:predicted TIM-barrel fold metal-dependent hydrolase